MNCHSENCTVVVISIFAVIPNSIHFPLVVVVQCQLLQSPIFGIDRSFVPIDYPFRCRIPLALPAVYEMLTYQSWKPLYIDI